MSNPNPPPPPLSNVAHGQNLRLLPFTGPGRVELCCILTAAVHALRQHDPAVADQFERALARDVSAALQRYQREGFDEKGGE